MSTLFIGPCFPILIDGSIMGPCRERGRKDIVRVDAGAEEHLPRDPPATLTKPSSDGRLRSQDAETETRQLPCISGRHEIRRAAMPFFKGDPFVSARHTRKCLNSGDVGLPEELSDLDRRTSLGLHKTPRPEFAEGGQIGTNGCHSNQIEPNVMSACFDCLYSGRGTTNANSG